MEEFLKYLITQLVDKKEAIKISKTEENQTVIFTIGVAPTDMGKIIGKEGRIISAIRNLLKILAVKGKKKIVVLVSEPQHLLLQRSEEEKRL